MFKIHGCISDPDSIVITQSDYEHFAKRKKYLSAKLLTYFSEHPLLFIGYSASDPNIQAILSDIDEALPVAGGLISNVYILEWKPNQSSGVDLHRERLIEVDDHKSVRIKVIQSNDFRWVFDAFGSHHTLQGVSPKTLRALLARSYDLVRRDIPRKTVDADFQMLESAVESPEGFAKLFGLTTISDPSALAAQYPYSLSDVTERLGLIKTGKKHAAAKQSSWHGAHKLIEVVKRDKKFDIKKSDNRYHRAEKYGCSTIHKYSEACVLLLRKVQRGEEYEL